MNKVSAGLYLGLLMAVFFSNKFVLSVLGFHYPMVFQGWQTLVGFVIFKLLGAGKVISVASIPLDRAGCISLIPNFLFFTAAIISGSKALSSIPVFHFLCVCNLLPAGIFTFDNVLFKSSGKPPATKPALAGAAAIIVTSVAIVGLEADGVFYTSAYFWLLVHLVCLACHSLHGRIADVRFNSVDRQYYSYIFSLVVLAPASFYLEEAFEALNYKELYQFLFIGGSLASAFSGVALHLYQSRLRNDSNFGRVHHLALILIAVLSMGVFETSFSSWVSAPLGLVNLGALLLIPSHILPDEEKLEANMSSATTAATSTPAKPSGSINAQV